MKMIKTIKASLLLSLAATCAIAATTPAEVPPPPALPADTPTALPADTPLATEGPATPAVAPITEEPVRGKLLYENHCQSCHTSKAHIREKRRAASIADLHHWVGRWTHELKLPWGSEEISDVVDYLNDTYYHYELPGNTRKNP
jgi:mono/diheme cytochrome c family protein